MVTSWCDGLNVGVNKMDADHQELAHLVALLRRSLKRGGHELMHQKLLNAFQKKAIEHFAEEESLMRAFGYPRFAEHRTEHAHLIDELLAANAKVSTGRLDMAMHADYLAAWLMSHIQRDDMPLYYFMKSRLHQGIAA